MATGRSTQLLKQLGEYRVAAELARRGLLVATFSGNVPHYDILASGQSGGHVPIQVKTKASGAWQLDIRKFAIVNRRGRKQVIGRQVAAPYPGMVYVFMAVTAGAEDRFFVVTWPQLRRLVVDGYRAFLKKHDGTRPKNPDSFHCAASEADLSRYEGGWHLITKRVKSAT